MRHRLGKLVWVLIGLALIADIGVTAGYYGLTRGRKGTQWTATNSQHAVVLFNDFDESGGPDAETLRRLHHAVKIVRCASGVIVCAGGARPRNGRFGSVVMREHLVAGGFDPERVLVEISSNSTRSNLAAASVVLNQSNIDSATIVSSPVHLLRVEHLAARLTSMSVFGFSAYDLDCTDPPVSRLTIFWQIQHELAAWAVDIIFPKDWQDWIIDRMRG